MRLLVVCALAVCASGAAVESNRNYGLQFDEEFSHHTYDTQQSLVDSQALSKRTSLSNKMFHINSSGTYLQLARDKQQNWAKLRFKKPKSVLFVETRPGQMHTAVIDNFAVTKCFSAELSSGSITVTKAVGFSRKLDVEATFEVSFDLASIINPATQVPAASKIGVTVATSMGKSSSIKCTASSGHRGQIFGTARLMYFPDAEARLLRFSYKLNEFAVEQDWTPIYTSEKYKEYGLVTYDGSRGVELACVDDEQYLQCDSELVVRPYDPEYDICEGLALALAGREAAEI